MRRFSVLLSKMYLTKLVIRAAPISVVHPCTYESLERRIWPIFGASHMTMFDWIPMNVINMFPVIRLIADAMLPKARLP